jgi:DNA-binding response OmpR family regulator
MSKVLVADDERNIVQLVSLYLRNEGFGVESASTGREAIERAGNVKPDLIILDLMMPDIDGWEACRQLRKTSNVPIIMLTARTDDVDKIVGLEIGADDYVTKPFNPRELVARVKAVLRRSQSKSVTGDRITLGNLQIDIDKREVRVNDKVVELRAKEFDLLVAFAQHPEVVLDRERLISTVWGYDFLGDSRTIDVHVTWLRDKLSKSDAKIKTVWGIGYKMIVESETE